MNRIYLIFAVVALTTAQNPRKIGKHGKHNAYLAPSSGGTGPSNNGGGGEHYGQSQYESPAPYKVHHGGGGNSHNDKPAYSQLLADTRTLNQDGTINFNFQADNGLQQGETVDPDGTRRGFYSYPGADGKQITVKYTAGKNGFIAEGDHLPLQPQAAAHNDKENTDDYTSPKRHQGRRDHNSGQYNPPPPHQSGAYNAEDDESSGESQYKRPAPAPYRNNGPSGGGARFQGGPSSHNNAPPSHYSSPSYSRGNDGGGSSFVGFGGDFPAPQQPSRNNNYAAAAPARGHPSSSGGHSSPHSYSFGGGPSPSYSSGAPSYSSRPAFGSGNSHRGGFTAANPYTSAGSGPYNGKFDLGNSGHFSIDFTPGAEQEYQPGGAGSSHSPSTASYARRPRPGPYFGRGPSGSRGQY